MSLMNMVGPVELLPETVNLDRFGQHFASTKPKTSEAQALGLGFTTCTPPGT